MGAEAPVDDHCFTEPAEHDVAWLDVAMNHAALMRVCQSGTDLFEIEERFLKRQRACLRERKQIAARQIFQHEVMESRSRKINSRAVSEAIYDVWMANTIERDCFVLEVRDERAL